MADELTGRITGAAIEVHRNPGPGLLESVYEAALCHEFNLRRIPYERQGCIDIVYKGMPIEGQRIDLVIANGVSVELKAVTQQHRIVLAQTLSCLKATGLRRALVINFGECRLTDGIKRVSLQMPTGIFPCEPCALCGHRINQ